MDSSHLENLSSSFSPKRVKVRVGCHRFVTTPELGILRSSSFLNHMEEPYDMAELPTDGQQGMEDHTARRVLEAEAAP